MIIPEKYTCDKCELVTPDKNDILRLSVNAARGSYGGHVVLTGSYCLMVCNSCAEKMGIKEAKGIPKDKQAPAPTIEDLIRQIIEIVGEG